MTSLKLVRFSATVLSKLAAVRSNEFTVRSMLSSAAGSLSVASLLKMLSMFSMTFSTPLIKSVVLR